MPYKSKAQAAYFNIHKKELEKQGVDVDEWNAASKGKKLPQKIGRDGKPTQRVKELASGAEGHPESFNPSSVAGKARERLYNLTDSQSERVKAPQYIKEKTAIPENDKNELAKYDGDEAELRKRQSYGPGSVSEHARQVLRQMLASGSDFNPEQVNMMLDRINSGPAQAPPMQPVQRDPRIRDMATSFIRAGNRQGLDGYDSQDPNVFRPNTDPGPPSPNPPPQGPGTPDPSSGQQFPSGGQEPQGGNYPWLQGGQQYNTQGYGNNGGFSPFPGFGQDLGFGMNPWDVMWGQAGGQYTAPLDPTAIAGIGNINQFVGNGMGLGVSQDYLQQLLSGGYLNSMGPAGDYFNETMGGKWLDPSTNPWLKQFQDSTGQLKETEDKLARQRIGSAMAAGGNALSGARLASEQQYQNTSDANYQKMIAEQMMQNLARERQLQQGAAQDVLGRYGQERGLQQQGVGLNNQLANTLMGGYGQQINAGMIPTNLANQNLQQQYNDWVRTTGNMYNDVTGGGKLFNDLMSGRYQWPAQPQDYTNSAAEGLLGALTGGGQGGLLGQLLKGLTGGGSSGKSSGSAGGGAGAPGGGGRAQIPDANGRRPGETGYTPTYSNSADQNVMDYLSGLGLSNDEIDQLLSGFDQGGGNAYIDPNTGSLTYEDPGGQNWTYDPSNDSFVPDQGAGFQLDPGFWGGYDPGSYDTGGATDTTDWGSYNDMGWT